MPKETITIRLDRHDAESLREAAEFTGTSFSEQVRLSVRLRNQIVPNDLLKEGVYPDQMILHLGPILNFMGLRPPKG